MLVLATVYLYDSTRHGDGGPSGHYVVDLTWSRRDAFKRQIYSRANRFGLRIELVQVYHEGLYEVGVPSPALKIFQRKLKQRYGTPPT